jgi:N-hydroxyarylamine O-acetyltransferase
LSDVRLLAADHHRAEKRWLESEAEFRDVLRGGFELNMTDEEIDQCVAVMKIKGTGDAPHPFFA